MEEEFEVVISGVSARMPDCDNLHEFMEKIYNKVSMTGINTKWEKGFKEAPYFSGQVKDTERYDNNVFSINAVQASSQIPTIMKILEMGYEAVIDAGIHPRSLYGSNCGVFMHAGSTDVEQKMVLSTRGRVITGSTKSYAANRLSFSLNLVGPSFAIDVGNGGMFYMLNRAAKEIRQGRMEACLVGACDFIHDVRTSADYLGLDMLAKDGECRPFDKDAHGFVRSEGGVVIFLQEASRAKRHRAVPIGFEFKFLGNQPLGFVQYDPDLIAEMLRDFYKKHKIDPRQIKYIETDGSGIKSRDELEIQILSRMFTENRTDELQIGSLVANCGYSESSSGLWGILKMVLSFEKDIIPPTRNHTEPDPQNIPLSSGKIKVVTEKTALDGDLFGVNSFHYASSFGHCLLKKPAKKLKEESKLDYHLWLLSSRTNEGLSKVMNLALTTSPTPDFTDLLNGVFHRQIQGHFNRGMMIMHCQEENKCLVQNTSNADSSMLRPLWFVFSGMGAQRNGMGNSLMRIPVFAEAIERCQSALEPYGIDIKDILTTQEPSIFDNILNSFIGITAVQIGLIEVLKKMGIKADKYVGHSLGELCCAYADGCLTLEETILCSWARGKASIESTLIHGMMAAVGKGYRDMKDLVPPSIEVACHNSNGSCTLSGPTEDVEDFVAQLQRDGVFAKAVNVSNIAYHSKYIIPIGERLIKYLREIVKTTKERSEKWISSSVPKDDWSKASAKNSCPEYYANNLLGPVLFEEAIEDIPVDAVVLEIAPQGLLLPILKRAFPGSISCLSLTTRNSNDDECFKHFLKSVGELYLLGYEPDPRAIYPPISYPVAPNTPDLASFVTWEHSFIFDYSEMVKFEPKEEDFFTEDGILLMKLNTFKHLFENHMFQSEPTIPLSFYLTEVWKLLAQRSKKNTGMGEIPIHFKNVHVHSVVQLNKIPVDTRLFIQLFPASGVFEVCLVYRKEGDKKLSGDVIVSGSIQQFEDDLETDSWISRFSKSETVRSLDANDLINVLLSKGFYLSPEFFNIVKLSLAKKVSKAKVVWKKNWQSLIDGAIKAGMFFDVDGDIVSQPLAIQSLILQPQEFDGFDYDCEFDLFLDNELNVITAGEGLQIKGLVFGTSAPNNQSIGSSLDCREFVPFFKKHFQEVEDFMSVSLEIIVDGCEQNEKGDYDLEICGCGTSIDGVLRVLNKTVHKCYPSQMNLLMTNSGQKSSGTNLLIADEGSLKAGLEKIANDSESKFILSCTSKSSSSLGVPGYLEVLQHVNKDLKYSLFKRKSQQNQSIYKVVKNNWCASLKSLKTVSDGTITLVWEKQPSINPHDVIEEMKRSGNLNDSIRCVFIMDKLAPTFSERNPFYAEQIKYGFAVNVLKDGVWGTLKKIPLLETHLDCLPDVANMLKFKREDVDIQFISLNPQSKRTVNFEHPVYVIEYSGITKDQRRVTGLAQYRPNTPSSEFQFDPKLVWEIPAGVSMEDAVTLPLSYCMANYALIMCSTAFEVESVLIHNGSSSIGLSCIAVALHAQLEVFTTVFSPEERETVKQKFPQIEYSNIIDCSLEKFNLRIMLLTGGRGVDFVVSNLPEKYIVDSWESVARFGCLIDFNETNMVKNSQLPMYHFLKCTTYYSCLKTSVFSLSDWRKEELWSLVQNTLTSSVFVKVPRQVFTSHQLNVVARALSKDEQHKKILMILPKHTDKFSDHRHIDKSIVLLNSNETYFITSPSISKCLRLAEWILVRGGRKLVLAVSSQAGRERRMSSLIDKYQADFLIFSTKKFTSGSETLEMMDKVKKLGPVSTLFNVNMDEKLAEYVATLLPSLRQIVTISKGEDSFDLTKNVKDDFKRLSIICKDGESYVGLLDEALLHNSDSKRNSFFSIRTDRNGAETKKQVILTEEYLPTSLEDLEDIGLGSRMFSDEHGVCADFVEVRTKSPLYRQVKDILPVFVLSSSPANTFKKLRGKLMYPMYFAKFAEKIPSVQEAAKHLYTSLCKINPTRPCSIIVETWHLATAAYLVKLIKGSGRETNLTLLPSIPENLSSIFSQDEDLEDIILRNVLNHASQEDYQNLYSGQDLDVKLTEMLRNEKSTLDKSLVISGVRTLKNQLEQFKNTRIPNRSFDCTITVVEIAQGIQFSRHDYAKISTKPVTVYRSPATSYDDLLVDKKLVKFLNKKHLFSWSIDERHFSLKS